MVPTLTDSQVPDGMSARAERLQSIPRECYVHASMLRRLTGRREFGKAAQAAAHPRRQVSRLWAQTSHERVTIHMN